MESKNLRDMTLEELRELKRQRYQQALRDGSISKCIFVAKETGEMDACVPKYLRKMEGLELYVDDVGGYATATYKGKMVMSTHPRTQLFTPGDWMQIVEMEYTLALAKKLAKEARERERERQKLIDEMEII